MSEYEKVEAQLICLGNKYKKERKQKIDAFKKDRKALSFKSTIIFVDFLKADKRAAIEEFITAYKANISSEYHFIKTQYETFHLHGHMLMARLCGNEIYELTHKYIFRQKRKTEDYMTAVIARRETLDSYVEIYNFVVENSSACSENDGNLVFDGNPLQKKYSSLINDAESIHDMYETKM